MVIGKTGKRDVCLMKAVALGVKRGHRLRLYPAQGQMPTGAESYYDAISCWSWEGA